MLVKVIEVCYLFRQRVYFYFYLIMSNLIAFPELQLSLRTERSSNIKTLHLFMLGYEGHRRHRHRIRHFRGFDFEIDSDEYKDEIQKTKEVFFS